MPKLQVKLERLSLADRFTRSVGIKNPSARNFLSEVTGTYILMAYGNGVIAQYVLFEGLGSLLHMCIIWGIAVTLAILASGKTSGGHLNPAISIAAATLGALPWYQVPIYIAGQMIGAFLGSATAYGLYYQAIVDFSTKFREQHATNVSSSVVEDQLCINVAKIFTTFPGDHLKTLPAVYITCIIDQIVSTALLQYGALSIIDETNYKIPEVARPPLVGALVVGVVGAFVGNCGAPLNPARDLGPRIVVALFGQGRCAFSAGFYYFWIPLVICPLGAILGGWMYKLTVSAQLQSEPPEETENHIV